MYKKSILSLLLIFGVNVIPVFAWPVIEEDSLALVALYDSTNGDNWNDTTGWNRGPVEDWYGVTAINGWVFNVNLSNNNLTGSIPPEIGDFARLLWSLNLSFNGITGSIPAEIGNLDSLTSLLLHYNNLSGSIPAEIGNMSCLKNLVLAVNQFTDSIPSEIWSLTDLSQLDLGSNQLSGEIPADIGNLTSLTGLYLYDNQLSGSIPTEIENMTSLTHLYIYDNDFVDLPSLTALFSLENLRIQNNKFTFEDIEPNIGIPSTEFIYSPQDSVGELLDTTITADSNFTMYVSVGGDNNQYQWKKDGSAISGANDTSYTIVSATGDDAGSYICEITNTVATALTLYSKPVNVTVDVSEVPSEIPEVYSMEVKRITADKNLELEYTVPEKANIKLSIYDINGKVIKDFSEEHQTGFYTRKIDMNDKPAGVYFIKMETNGKKFKKTAKVILVR